jgi:serine protease Do
VASSALALAQPQPNPQTVNPKAYLGVMVAPAKDTDKGILVREVMPGSPAEKAGVKSGDIILKVGDQDVKDADNFLLQIAAKKVGEKVTIQVQRNGKEETLTPTLIEYPQPTAQDPRQPTAQDPRQPTTQDPRQQRGVMLGVRAEPLNADLKTRLNVTTDTGAVIMEVVPNSAADKAGLKRDDVIITIDGKPIKNTEELHKAVESTGVGKEVTIEFFRGNDKKTVKATLQGS